MFRTSVHYASTYTNIFAIVCVSYNHRLHAIDLFIVKLLGDQNFIISIYIGHWIMM